MSTNEKKTGDLFSVIWTIPNILTFIRILLVPVFACLYINATVENRYIFPVIGILILSGLTDFLDGKIARKFNQVSPLGKILDPVADKITQITLALILLVKFRGCESPSMKAFAWVFLVFLIKEAIMVLGGLVMLLVGLRPGAAEIYGKVATFVFYGFMIIIITFGPEIGAVNLLGFANAPVLPEIATYIMVIISAILTIIALCSYVPGTLKMFKERNSDK